MHKSPFKFLDSYTKEDKDIFFGRENEVEEIYHKIFSSKTLLVYGVSGTGKSSIIQCGLANRFEDSDWLPVSIRRGSDMNASFEKALAKIAVTPIEPLFEDKANGIAKAVQSVYLDHFKPIYFIFDQFEELFIFGSKAEKKEFIQTVNKIIKSNIQTKFVFVIREEYLAGITEFETDLTSIMENRIRIEKMSLKHAKEVIEGSCKAGGIEVEEGFSEALLENLKSSSGEIELTYLQVYLDRIYQKAVSAEQSKTVFTKVLLEGLGDVADILGNFLDEQIKKLPDPESGTTVLKSFVSLKGTKKQVTEEEVSDSVKSFGKEMQPEQIREIIRQFTSFRILKDKDESGKYELRHDALAMKIYEKITMLEKELLEVRQYIENAYSTYKKNGLLLGKESLKYIELYLEKLYLEKSITDFISLCAEKVKQEENQLVFTLMNLSSWAVKEKERAEKNEIKAKALYYNSLAKEIVKSDPIKALAVAEHALELDPQNEDIYRNITSIYYDNPVPEKVVSLEKDNLVYELSPDKKTFLIHSGSDLTVNLYFIEEDRFVEIKTSFKVNNAVLSPDSKSIFICTDSIPLLINFKGETIKEFNGFEEIVSATFSPDGQSVLLFSYGKPMILCDLKGNTVQNFTKHKYFDFSNIPLIIKNTKNFSPDGKRIVIGSGEQETQTTQVWNTEGGLLKEIGQNQWFNNFVFSPDGKSIMMNSPRGRLMIWDSGMSSGRDIQIPSAFSAHYIAFSYDGKKLTAGLQGSACIWDLDGNLLHEFKTAGEDIVWAGFIDAEDKFITCSHNGKIRFWNLEEIETQKIKTKSDDICSFVFSPDDSCLVAGYRSGLITMFNNEGELLSTFEGHTDRIQSIRYSPDGKNILTSSCDGTAIVWDYNGNILNRICGHEKRVWNACYSPDGNIIATAAEDGNLILWNLNGDKIAVINDFPVYAIDFSRDGSRILTTTFHSVIVRDIKGNILKTLKGPKRAIQWASFTPEDEIVAVGWDGGTIVWDKDYKSKSRYSFSNYDSSRFSSSGISPQGKMTATNYKPGMILLKGFEGKPLMSFSTGPNENIYPVVFNKEGSKLAAGSSENSTIYIWNLKKPYEDFKNVRKYEILDLADKLEFDMVDISSVSNYSSSEYYNAAVRSIKKILTTDTYSNTDKYFTILEKIANEVKNIKSPHKLTVLSFQYYKVWIFKEGLEIAQSAYEKDTSDKFLLTSVAIGNLLNNNWKKAEEIYEKYKNETYISFSGAEKRFRDKFINDIEELEKYEIAHPDFEKVRELLKDKNEEK